jgi:hypothetical protein
MGGVMKVNVGSLDKVLRVVVGLVIIGAGIAFRSWWGVIGVIPLATAAVGFCPLYTLLGVSTRK